MKTLTIICLFFLPIVGFSQEKWVQGIIIIDNSEEKGEGIYVTNTRSNHTTLSNFVGTFFIKAQVNDTLRFRSDWYENRIIVLTPSMFANEKIVVHLAAQIIQLQTAYIGPKLTGILERDVTAGKVEDRMTRLYRQLGVNPDIKPLRDTSKIDAGLFGKDINLTSLDVGRLYDAFSGNLRRRAALVSYESKHEKLQLIRAYYGDNYFTNELGIPSFKIDEFIENAIQNNKKENISINDPNYFRLLTLFNTYRETYLDQLFGKGRDKHLSEKDSLISKPMNDSGK